jgi:hypothetical protein
VDVFTDGEYCRSGWTGGLPQAVDGFIAPPTNAVAGPVALRWRGEHLDLLPRTFGLHMCRGNYRSNYFAEAATTVLRRRVFPQLNYDRFLLEYDTARAGGFEPLRFVPRRQRNQLG